MTVAAEPNRTKANVSRSRGRARGRLRAGLAGLAAVFGVLLGALTFPAAAQAADFNHWVLTGGDSYLDIGGAAATVTVEVQSVFRGPGPETVVITGNLEGLDGLASVDVQEGHCTRTGPAQATCADMQPNEKRQIQFTIAPAAEADLPQGEQKKGKLKFDAGGRGDGVKETNVTIIGNGGPQSATDITGTITSNAEPIADAKVVLTDAEGADHETTTNANGEFAFHGGQGTVIAPGQMTLTVTKDGFEDLQESIEVSANSSFQQNLTMVPVQAEPEETSAAPTEAEPSEAEPEPSEEPNEGGISSTLVFLIVVGGLLVVGGIVGIVFLLRGGKDDKSEDDDGESFADGPPEHQPTAAQVGSPGVYQAGPAPGQDAPTMIHNGPLVQDQEAGSPGAPTPGFGPAYGPGSDATQVMPQAGGPGALPPAVGPNDTQILSTVKGLDRPGGVPSPPMSDATQVMPQANMSSRPPQSSFSEPGATQPYQPGPFSDPGATQPYPSPTPPPSPPAGRPPNTSMFEPPQQPGPGSQPSVSRDPYAPPPSPTPYQSQPPPAADPYQGHGRDPYAPPPSQPASGPPADPYAPPPTQAMPQGGHGGPTYGSQPHGPAPTSPYAAGPAEDAGAPSPRPREDEEPRGWGEWDDRPRSW